MLFADIRRVTNTPAHGACDRASIWCCWSAATSPSPALKIYIRSKPARDRIYFLLGNRSSVSFAKTRTETSFRHHPNGARYRPVRPAAIVPSTVEHPPARSESLVPPGRGQVPAAHHYLRGPAGPGSRRG